MTLNSAAEPSQGLRRNYLSRIDVVAQSIGLVAPVTSVATLVAIVGLSTGTGSWVTWALVTVAVLSIAYCVARIAGRYVTAGGVASLSGHVLGRTVGFYNAILYLTGAVLAVPVVSIGFGLFASQFLVALGATDSRTLHIVCNLLALIVAAALCYRDVKLSARALLVIELLAMTCVTVLLTVVLIKRPGGVVDTSQLHFSHMQFGAILPAAALAFSAFGGFDSAVMLGREAKDPRRAVPLALLASTGVVGLFFIFASYAVLAGFESVKGGLGGSQSPFVDLVGAYGMHWATYVLLFLAAVSMLSSLIAMLNAFPRIGWSMAVEGILPKAFARTHPRHQTPTLAIIVLAATGAVVVTTLAISGADPLNLYAYLSTLLGLLLSTALGLFAIGAVVYLARRRELRLWDVIAGAVAVTTVGYVLYKNFSPAPVGPYRVVAGVYVALLSILLLFIVFVRATKAELLGRLGSSSLGTSTALDSDAARPAASSGPSATHGRTDP